MKRERKLKNNEWFNWFKYLGYILSLKVVFQILGNFRKIGY